MSNRSRRHLALYYVFLTGGIGKGVSPADRDYPEFLDLLGSVLAGTGYRLYALCLLPGQVHLAVQMSQVPLADFLQRLAIRYGEWMQHKHQRPGDLRAMHEPKLFERSDRLCELIRFIHLLPLKLGRNPDCYLWSGQRAYLGKARVTCLDCRSGLQLFGRYCREARINYEKYFHDDVQACVNSKQNPRPPTSTEPLDELACNIARLGSRRVGDVRSPSRERLCSLIRAMILWHASRLGFASAAEISQYLNRDPSSLYTAVKRYSALHPELFDKPGDYHALERISAVTFEEPDASARQILLRQPPVTDYCRPS